MKFEEAKQLPVDDRVTVVDSLLQTLNVPNPEIDKAWADVADARLAELRSGRVKPVPGDRVLPVPSSPARMRGLTGGCPRVS